MTSSIEASSAVQPPQVAVNDIGSADDFLAAIDATIKYFDDGDIVEGTVVKVDRDEVLLDIGYKTEGVIPSRELSIKHYVDAVHGYISLPGLMPASRQALAEAAATVRQYLRP